MINLSYNTWIFFQQLIKPLFYLQFQGSQVLMKFPKYQVRVKEGIQIQAPTNSIKINPFVYDPDYLYISGF